MTKTRYSKPRLPKIHTTQSVVFYVIIPLSIVLGVPLTILAVKLITMLSNEDIRFLLGAVFTLVTVALVTICITGFMWAYSRRRIIEDKRDDAGEMQAMATVINALPRLMEQVAQQQQRGQWTALPPDQEPQYQYPLIDYDDGTVDLS
jgi:heme/copper-type cytochrome/quinol oxidase subunit 2